MYIGQERRRVCLSSAVSWREFSTVCAALFVKEGLHVKVMKLFEREIAVKARQIFEREVVVKARQTYMPI